MITLKKKNDVYLHVKCDKDIKQEISERFRFQVDNFQHHPLYKNGIWDGYKKLFNGRENTIYYGLKEELIQFANDRGYSIIDETEERKNNYSREELENFCKEIIVDNKQPRDYQFDTIYDCINSKRRTFISPTASGKSLIIYTLLRFFDLKTLIIVPNISLSNQLISDFSEYTKDDWDVNKKCDSLYSGKDKKKLKQVTVSTYQTAVKQSEEWVDQFDMIICDEVHMAKAKSIVDIMEKSINCEYKYGFTGTLDGVEVNVLTISGLFGPVNQFVTTKELIDKGVLSDMKARFIILKHNKDLQKEYKEYIKKYIVDNKKQKLKKSELYQLEIKFLFDLKERNELITKLIYQMKGNTLILFKYIEHGEHMFRLYDSIKKDNQDVYYISGKIKGEEREIIRKYVNNRDRESILFASEQTTAVGVNIPNIDNLFIIYPTKSVIKVLQSLGRGLRKSDTKEVLNMIDISDDMKDKGTKNYTYNHMLQRLKIYTQQKLEYKIVKHTLEKKK